MSDDILLRIIQSHYGSRWRIRRTDSLWIARAHEGGVSDVVHDDVDAFLSELEFPRSSLRAAVSLLSAPYFSDRAECRGDGAYLFEDSP